MRVLPALIAAALLVGCSAPAPVTHTPSVSAEIGVTEDFLYESEPEPSGIRGLTVGELLEDAWAVGPHTVNNVGSWAMVPDYAASFDGQPDMSKFDGAYFPVPSIAYPGVFHVFKITAAERV